MNHQQDKQKVINWAQDVLTNKDDWLILDTETTGLDDQAEIVQLAVIDLDGNTIIDTLVKPTVAISKEASDIHGITKETVKDAPSFPEVYSLIEEKIRKKFVLIYNRNFDVRILKHCCEINNLNYFNLLIISECLMEKYAICYGDWNENYQSYKWQKLPGGDHTALGDCKASLTLLHGIAQDRVFVVSKKNDNSKKNIAEIDYQLYEYAVKSYQLTELETKLLYLETLTRNLFCSEFYWEAPALKTKNHYMTNDGYSTDCFVWYISCFIFKRKICIFGSTPENTTQNAIDFFEEVVSRRKDKDNMYKYIQDFNIKQRKKCNEYAKFKTQ